MRGLIVSLVRALQVYMHGLTNLQLIVVVFAWPLHGFNRLSAVRSWALPVVYTITYLRYACGRYLRDLRYLRYNCTRNYMHAWEQAHRFQLASRNSRPRQTSFCYRQLQSVQLVDLVNVEPDPKRCALHSQIGRKLP